MFSVYVCVCVFLCLCTGRVALRRADHSNKESYRLSLIKKLRKLSPMLQKPEQAPKCGSNEEEKKTDLEIRFRTYTAVLVCFVSKSMHGKKRLKLFEIIHLYLTREITEISVGYE
jgi:hypothetical protein